MKTSPTTRAVAVRVQMLLAIRLLMFAENVAVAAAAAIVPDTRSPVAADGHRDRPTATSPQPDEFCWFGVCSTATVQDDLHYHSMLSARAVEMDSIYRDRGLTVVPAAFRDVGNEFGEGSCSCRRGKNSRSGDKSGRGGMDRSLHVENRPENVCQPCSRKGRKDEDKRRDGNSRDGKNNPRTAADNNGGEELIVDNKVAAVVRRHQWPRTKTTVSGELSSAPLNVGQDTNTNSYWNGDVLWLAFEMTCVAFVIVSFDCLTTFGCRRRYK